MTPRRPGRVRQLAARLRPHVRGACRCPACDTAEQKTRAQIGMPRLHPERIVRPLGRRDEAWLQDVTEVLWPNDEYTLITEQFHNPEDLP